MPRISIDNYDTVATWNGDSDLFIVEQPDGTKVATPAMVKQFIEAGDFEATGEVKDGHGNILKDMAKSTDVAAEIGDLSQTGLTGDSVSEQLATAGEQIANLVRGKVDRLVSSSNGTTQTINVGASSSTNRMYLIAAGYSSQYSDSYVFGLILINSGGGMKYVSLKDTSITVSAAYTNGIVTLTFSAQVYSNAVLIRLS